MRSQASSFCSPLNSPGALTMTPGSTVAALLKVDGGDVVRAYPGGRTTTRMGRSNFLANSQSRSSDAGTAMIAPVPYWPST